MEAIEALYITIGLQYESTSCCIAGLANLDDLLSKQLKAQKISYVT